MDLMKANTELRQKTRDQETAMMEIKERMTEQKRKIDYLRRGKLDVEDNVKKMKVSYRMVNEGFERVVLLHLFSYNEVLHSKFVFTDAFKCRKHVSHLALMQSFPSQILSTQ